MEYGIIQKHVETYDVRVVTDLTIKAAMKDVNKWESNKMLALKFTSPQSEHEQAIERSITVFRSYEYNRIFARTKHSYLYNKRLYIQNGNVHIKWFIHILRPGLLPLIIQPRLITRLSNIINTTT